MRVAISAVIIQNGMILLVRKKKTWILPGGKPKQGEEDEQCLLREFKEELPGVKLKIKDFYKSFKGITPYKKDLLRNVVYFADVKGKISPSAEINETIWTNNPEGLNLSDITQKVIASLCEDGYL